jgi:hypothetical protein
LIPLAVKKSLFWSLVFLLILNVFGYYLFFGALQYSNDIAMTRRLDADLYNENEAITIRLPLTVPYLGDDKTFRRAEGKFWHEGQFYRMVKQKYARDTLTVICVRDNEKVRIHEAISEFVKTFTDNPVPHQASSKLVLFMVKDYLRPPFALGTSAVGWQSEIKLFERCLELSSTFTPSISHPPECA